MLTYFISDSVTLKKKKKSHSKQDMEKIPFKFQQYWHFPVQGFGFDKLSFPDQKNLLWKHFWWAVMCVAPGIELGMMRGQD